MEDEIIEETTDNTELEQALEEKRQAEERATKYENRFKKTAKELNELKAKPSEDDVDVESKINKRLQEEMFYFENPVAKQFKNEIEKVRQDNNLSPEKAFKLFLADNHPELLWKQQDTSVEWVDKPITPSKPISEMSLEDINAAIAAR